MTESLPKNSAFQPVTPAIVDALVKLIGPKNVSTAEADRNAHSFDVSGHPVQSSEVLELGGTATDEQRNINDLWAID